MGRFQQTRSMKNALSEENIIQKKKIILKFILLLSGFVA